MKILVDSLADHVDKQPSEKASDEDPVDGSNDAGDLPRKPEPASVSPGEAGVPEAWCGESAVLCIAGRGPLDEAASAMLVQLLAKHGMGARLVSYKEVGRDGIETLDVQGVRMACISYLDISGSPAHLRYLIQRLRRRLPKGAPILVGLWPSEDSTLKDPAMRAQVGSDYFTSSLTEAVTSCAEAAAKEAEPTAERRVA